MLHKPNGIRHQDAHLSKIELPDEVMKKLMIWLKNPKGFLVFVGNPGVGKTYFCSAVANYYLEQGRAKTLYSNERELLASIRSQIKDSDFEYSREIEKMAGYEYAMGQRYIWMLDDIGSSQMTEWQKEVLLTFVDALYQHKTPAIITSNVWMKEMKEKFSDRFHSRLASIENMVIELNGQDKRQQGF